MEVTPEVVELVRSHIRDGGEPVAAGEART